jgi:preprotein translocase subunit SecA
MREAERNIMLNVIDDQWKDHLLSMDHLKEGIGLRGYGQKDPLVEYKKESYVLFQDMMDRIEDETIRYLFFLPRPLAPSPPLSQSPCSSPCSPAPLSGLTRLALSTVFQ